jgi:hypothetical protein
MARRRSSDGAPRRKKSPAEARAERITWALMVLVFAIVQLLPGALPNYFVPFAGSVILLGSGFYQYARRWHVSPVTWIGGALMAFFAYYSLRINAAQTFMGETLIIFFLVIVIGLLTGET